MLMPSSEGTSEYEDGVIASVLHAAASSGSEEMFAAVLAAMEGAKLTPDEVPRFNHTNNGDLGTRRLKYRSPCALHRPGGVLSAVAHPPPLSTAWNQSRDAKNIARESWRFAPFGTSLSLWYVPASLLSQRRNRRGDNRSTRKQHLILRHLSKGKPVKNSGLEVDVGKYESNQLADVEALYA